MDPASSWNAIMCPRNDSKIARAFEASSGLFLSNGSTATLMGATRGWNLSTTRVSLLPFASVSVTSLKAFASNARMSRSTPADGSMTCGMYWPLARPSASSCAAAPASATGTPDFVRYLSRAW